jgi:hypothetical protein
MLEGAALEIREQSVGGQRREIHRRGRRPRAAGRKRYREECLEQPATPEKDPEVGHALLVRSHEVHESQPETRAAADSGDCAGGPVRST